MKALSLCTLLLVSSLSAQVWAQSDNATPIEAPTTEGTLSEPDDFEESEGDEWRARVKGFLDSYHAARTKGDGDWMASRSRVRGEVKLEQGRASLFVSLNATYNALLKEQTSLALREAYLTYTQGNFDVQVGRQIIVWGVADGLRITDCVSPFDYTEFLAQDYDDIRMPVNAIRSKYTWGNITWEAVFTPIPEVSLLSTHPRNPWAIRLPSILLPYTIDFESNKPTTRLRNMEYGTRLSVTLQGVDFSLCALHSWNKMPAMETRLVDLRQSLQIVGKYHRITLLGADCSLPIGECVLRAEGAYYIGEAQSAPFGHEVTHRNTLNSLVGLDWYAGNDWNLSIQYSHKYTPGDLNNITAYRHAGLATARVSKELLQNRLKLSTFAYVDIADGGVFNRLAASYALTDQVELTAGYDYFHGDKGLFSLFRNNSEVWGKMKYSF